MHAALPVFLCARRPLRPASLPARARFGALALLRSAAAAGLLPTPPPAFPLLLDLAPDSHTLRPRRAHARSRRARPAPALRPRRCASPQDMPAPARRALPHCSRAPTAVCLRRPS
ncbi:uncharacterized protein M421DRAFT_417392 [Didymella exigua CBS 183.55]|uniref:Uncharacterized protein n=1 Tax=Didymella exigua CBS 183.55 TaxID=1150837 RepID=A0A6A5S267_9PLEO|nr:uncharacterized protein M421DRAFT_417392 [Didymella exigua CBS 183.55]KAF1931627.1 hypothetical protein M421DRAFT_417392 [Didymella exigua CBS 183.55]